MPAIWEAFRAGGFERGSTENHETDPGIFLDTYPWAKYW